MTSGSSMQAMIRTATEIERMSRRQGSQSVRVEFSPPLPHLLALEEGEWRAVGYFVR